jgi:hypothetical protein
MQTRHLVIATAFVASLGLGACSSNPTNAQIGTGAGAVVGGVAGNALFGTARRSPAQAAPCGPRTGRRPGPAPPLILAATSRPEKFGQKSFQRTTHMRSKLFF